MILVPSSRPVDLLRKLNENQPQVVHFSSHGTPDAIVLEAGDDNDDAVGGAAVEMRSADERDMKSARTDTNAGGGGVEASLKRSANRRW